MVGFSVYVNPWGNFGPTGYHNMYNARLAKTAYIDGLSPDRRPEVITLGSSNTMRFRPKTIERLLGKSAFNYAVFWGAAEDFLCIARHLVDDLNHRPDLLIVGLETWTFKPPGDEHPIFPGVRRRLLNTPQLIRHHPDINGILIPWSKFVDSFSQQQLALSWRLVRGGCATRETYPPLGEHRLFDLDGTRVYYGDLYGKRDVNIFDDVEAGVYPITEHLAEAADSDRPGAFANLAHYDFDGLWESRIGYFEQFVRFCDDRGIEIIVVINPVHPVFWDVIAERTPHLKNLAQLRNLLERIGVESPAVLGVVDASRIEDFGGDADGFYDEIHFATSNADLILELVAELIRKR